LATNIIRDGTTIRVEWPVRWYGRLFSIVLLAPSLYFFYYVALALKYDISGESPWREDLPGVLALVALGLVFGVPGLMAATFRYFLLIDKTGGQVTVNRQFGPVRFRRLRKLSEFSFISVTRELDNDQAKRFSTFNVNLCGVGATRPVTVSGFPRRQAADDFARELGGTLGLNAKDVADSEPDDPEREDRDDKRRSIPKSARSPSRKGNVGRGAKTESALLASLSLDGDRVRIALPMPTFVYFVLVPLLLINALIWTFIAKVLGDIGFAGVWAVIASALRGTNMGAVAAAHPTPAHPLLVILGAIALPLATGLPCLTFMTANQYLEIDKARREIARVRNYAFDWITFRSVTALSKLANVAIERRRAETKAEPFVVAIMAAPGSRAFDIAQFETRDSARTYAGKLARATGLPIVEAV
jgi:hypothetical protein